MAFLKTQVKKYYKDMKKRGEMYHPPEEVQREWGWIPFSVTSDTTMHRHESIIDYDSLEDYLITHGPAHMYHSVARYDAPSERIMSEKGWRGADLIFDLDADHLEQYDPDAEYSEMLEEIKVELLKLIDILDKDLGFDNMMVTFSGNRGYHVYVRDEDAIRLGKDSRRQIVDYIRGTEFELDDVLIERQTGTGDSGRKTSNTLQYFNTDGGWSRRIHESFCRYMNQFILNDEISTEEKIEELKKFNGVGENKATAALNFFQSNEKLLVQKGRFSPHPAGKSVMKAYADMVIEDQNSHIDEPVSTDINRLIRLPKSIHGGSGLQVTPIEIDKIEEFNPTVDAVPSFFTKGNVTLKITNGGEITINNKTVNVETGDTATVSKEVAVFMMARGRAEYIDHKDSV